MPDLNIRKIHRSSKKLTFVFLNGEEEHSASYKDNPLPTFGPSLDALAPIVCELCELPRDYIAGLTVSGLTLCESGKVECVTIVAKKEIAGNSRPFNIATPLIPIDQPEEGEGSHLTIAQAILVETALEEARKYIRGERSQGQMKLTPEESKEEETDGEAEADDGKLVQFAGTA